MNAYDAAMEVYERTRDALKLAEQAKAYTDGEQWAVDAVLFLRRETARTLRSVCQEDSASRRRQLFPSEPHVNARKGRTQCHGCR